MTIRAVLFDIDGTLIDSNEEHVKAWSLAFDEAGHAQEEEAIRAQIGKGGDLLVPTLLPDMDEATRDRIAGRHGEIFKDLYLDGVRPFDRAAELIARVGATGRTVMLASSAKREELEVYVDRLGVADLIDDSVTIDDVETSKPAPDIFGVALDRLGIPAAETIAIGDTIYDVAAAGRAGIATIGLTSGPFDEAALRDAGAIAVFRDVADLLASFDRSPLADG